MESQNINRENLNRLICSFKSDFPNEIDFAMQVSIILANTNNFTWSQDYQLVDAICQSLHVYTCVCDKTVNCLCYPRFWHKLITKNIDNVYLQVATVSPDIERGYLDFNSLEDFNIENQTKIYRRIKLVAELIQQFSLTKESKTEESLAQFNYVKKKVKASPSLLYFVSLLYHCHDKTFNLIGLDILSNIGSKLSKIPDVTNDIVCRNLVQMFQERCVKSICQDTDIYFVNRSLDVVSKLISSSSRKVSSTIVSLIHKNDVITRLEELLTSYDVTLFLSALEFCYKLSSYHPELMSNSKYLLKILINLLEIEDTKYFSKNALKRISLTGANTNISTTASSLPTQTLIPSSVAPPLTSAPVPNPAPSVVPTPPNPPQTVTDQQPKYRCLWDGCTTEFVEAKDVYDHVFSEHISKMPADTLTSCLWSGPQGSGPGCLTKRPKFSLLTHLNDFHCNLKALSRSQPTQPPVHPGYAANAAVVAIRRHNHNNQQKSVTIHKSNLSTSVRLTAALIIRNLARESSHMKRALESYESLLSEISMSERDEGKIVAECLSLIIQ